MANRIRMALAALAGATLLAGCATGPYYDYGYDDRYGYGPGYGYDYGPSYYGYPGYYAGPTIGFGATYVDRDRRHWRDDDRRWRDRDGHRDRRESRQERPQREENRNPLRREDRAVPELPQGGGSGGYDWRNDHGQDSPG